MRTIEVSDYAIQHPDYYGLRTTGMRWDAATQRHVREVELVLFDADGTPIDEDGCNCDLDSPCNNPRCVMERGQF